MKKIYLFVICTFLFCLSPVNRKTPVGITSITYDKTPIICYTTDNFDSIQYALPQTATIKTVEQQTIIENIIWDTSPIHLLEPGYYQITGKLENESFYTDIPFIELSVQVKSILMLNSVRSQANSITIQYIDHQEHCLLETNNIKVWMAKFTDYRENRTWYNVTQFPNVKVTPSQLILSDIDFSIDEIQQLQLQISYDHPKYDLYSVVYRLFRDEDNPNTIYLQQERGGDRHGGNREENPEIDIPADQEIQVPDDKPSTPQEDDQSHENETMDTPQDGNPTVSQDHTNISIEENIAPDITYDRSSFQKQNQIYEEENPVFNSQKEIRPIINNIQTPIIIQKPITTTKETSLHQNEVLSNHQKISAKNIAIPFNVNPTIPIFIVIGIALGIITIKRMKHHEKK